jgi:hypothetical protein
MHVADEFFRVAGKEILRGKGKTAEDLGREIMEKQAASPLPHNPTPL